MAVHAGFPQDHRSPPLLGNGKAGHRPRSCQVARDDADDENAEQLLDCDATLCTPSRVAAAQDEVARIESALADLPENQRDALAMSRMMGLGYREIAETMGRTESAARGLVARGLAHLAMMFPD